MLSAGRKAGKDERKHGSTEKEKAKDHLLSGDPAGYHGTAAAHPENARRAERAGSQRSSRFHPVQKDHLSLCGAVSALCTIPYLVQKIRIQPAGKIRANGGLCTHPVLLYCVPSELALKKHFSKRCLCLFNENFVRFLCTFHIFFCVLCKKDFFRKLCFHSM